MAYNPPRGFSHTQLNMYLKCPAQFEQRYILGKKKPPNGAMIRGSAVHQSIRKDLKAKMETGALLTVEGAEQVAADYVDKAFHGDVMLDAEEAVLGFKVVKGMTTDESVRMAAKHHFGAAPFIYPKMVENRLLVHPRGCDVKLVGYFDTITEDNALEDTKTTSKSPNSELADKSMQLTFYDLLCLATPEIGQLSGLMLRFLVGLKKGVKIVEQKTARSTLQHTILLDVIGQVLKGINNGHFPPTLPDNWWCSNKWCGYYADDCNYVRR